MSRFGLDECEHARVWAALAPDGELSELERRSLRAHVRTCDACAAFASEVERLALLLRNEALTRPSFAMLVPSVARRRRVFVARVRPVAAVAAVALMALGITARAPLQMDGHDSSLSTTTAASGSEQVEMQSLRVLRQGALVAVDRSRLEPMVVMVNRPA